MPNMSDFVTALVSLSIVIGFIAICASGQNKKGRYR